MLYRRNTVWRGTAAIVEVGDLAPALSAAALEEFANPMFQLFLPFDSGRSSNRTDSRNFALGR